MIKLIKPYIQYSEVEEDFKKIFESGTFTRGPYVGQLAETIKSFTGSSQCHLTTSATTALWVCLKILGIKPGDEVIVSDFSFPATANVVEDLGAIPVFADVALNTFNMQPEELIKKITQKTKAVIFVDALGNPSGATEIKKICKAYNIPMIEDAACAIGSKEFGVPVGNIADLSCFSFHPRKLLTTGEGGAITLNSVELSNNLAIKLLHGADGMDGPGMNFVDYGYNFRLSELQAAMGIIQIKKIDQIVESRLIIRKSYCDRLEKFGYQCQSFHKDVIHNVQSLVFHVPKSKNRNNLIQHLKQCGIESTIGTYSMSSIKYYKDKYNSIQSNSNYLFNHTITLPCYDGVDIDRVADAIIDF